MTSGTYASPTDLNRFAIAQQSTCTRVLTDLTRGHKASHWMWFIFPQVAGLRSIEMSRR